MLNADSRTLKNDSAVQRRTTPPMLAIAAASFRTVLTRSTTRMIGTPGSDRRISRTRKLDSSARPVSPSSASARNVSGTKESNAKYAIIAARCVPRSAKNFANSVRLRTLTGSVWFGTMDAARALADLAEISSQIESAVIVDDAGAIAGSTLADGGALAEAGRG